MEFIARVARKVLLSNALPPMVTMAPPEIGIGYFTISRIQDHMARKNTHSTSLQIYRGSVVADSGGPCSRAWMPHCEECWRMGGNIPVLDAGSCASSLSDEGRR